MKTNFPFTDYDFWAYISSGFVLLFALDHIFEKGWIMRDEWSLSEGIFIVAGAYIVGHLLAGIASALLERRVVGVWLGAPSSSLLGVRNGPTWFRALYPSYYQALPSATYKKIVAKAAAEDIVDPDAMFWLAFSHTRRNSPAMDRMSSFLNQYGMCRNMSLTLFFSALLLAVAGIWFDRREDYWWAAAALVLGIGMFLRYLKFYRHYAVEVYTAFAHDR